MTGTLLFTCCTKIPADFSLNSNVLLYFIFLLFVIFFCFIILLSTVSDVRVNWLLNEYKVAQKKVSHYQIIKKLCWIV